MADGNGAPLRTAAEAMAQLLADAEELARPRRKRERRRGLRGDADALDVVVGPDGRRRWRYA